MGSGGGIPNIGVRLTAQGVQDIVNAFQRVRQEAKTAGQESAASFGILNAQLSSLGSLLPALSIGAAVTGIVALGANALQTAVSVSKLSEKTGISAETLSVLGLAAQETGTDQDVLSKGLVKLAKSMQDAANGAAKPKKAFSDLGITLKDLQTNDPGQIFGMIADKIGSIESPTLRAQAVIGLFGKAGGELIPILNQVAEQGFGNLQAKAERFGLYLGADFLAQARQTESDLADLKAAGEGAALQFTTGLLPAVDGLAQAFLSFVGGAEGLQRWGHIVGTAVLSVAEGFSSLVFHVQEAKGYLDLFDSKLEISQNRQKDIGNAKNDINQAKLDYAARSKALDSAYAATFNPAKSSAPAVGGLGAVGDGLTDEEKAKRAQAYSAYLQSLADNKLSIQKLTNQIAEAEDKRSYDAGLLTVDDYYDKVEARAQAEAEQEIATLQQKRQAAAALPDTTQEQQYKRLEEIGKIDAQITEVGLRSTAAQAAAEQDRAKAKHDNALRELEDEEKLQKASGDTYGAEQTALQIELQQYTELLQKRKDLTSAQKDALVQDYSVRGSAKIGFGQNNAEAGRLTSSLNDQIGAVQDQAANGSITQVSAQAQILDLETKQLAILQPLLEVMKEQALTSKDPALLAQWTQLNASVTKVAASMKNVTTAQTYLINQITTEGRQDFEDFFSSIIDGSKSASDAFADLAADFEKIVAQMVSKLLIFYALESILGWVAPDSSFLKSLTAAGPFGKYDGGGWTGGTAGRAAGIVHGEEFVVKAGPAGKYRNLLEAINNGTNLPPVQSVSSTRSIASSYAESVDGSGGDGSSGAPLVQVINTTGQPTQQKQTTGAGGKSITQIIIGESRTDIARGGDLAKVLESTYGLRRGGTIRG